MSRAAATRASSAPSLMYITSASVSPAPSPAIGALRLLAPRHAARCSGPSLVSVTCRPDQAGRWAAVTARLAERQRAARSIDYDSVRSREYNDCLDVVRARCRQVALHQSA